jgi:NodT family efflux transporter outer membrane factor (OMF) lipoprotein
MSIAMCAKRVMASAIACGVLLLLPACCVPPLRQAQLGTVLPASYAGATSPENSAQLRVDEFYNDPTLTQLVCQAMAGNRELKAREEEVQVARNEILSRRGAFLPAVGFRGSAGMDRNSLFTPLGAAERELEYLPGRHFPDPLGDFLLGFNFLVPLDIWRELRNARDASRQRYFAAVERRNDFVTRMVAEIAEKYYELMALDQRLATLDRTITLQQQSLEVARARLAAARDTELPVQRFLAEVRRNQSEKLIVRQEIVETENRINFLAGRLPQPVERNSSGFFELNLRAPSVGVPAQLLLYRPDVRQAERELAAAGLDVLVARARFFPRVDLTGGIGYRAFNPKYLFDPEALIANAAGELTAPVINRAAIRAEYLTANARQLQSVYNYQRVILTAVTEVVNRLSAVENYGASIAIKRQQLQALETAVDVAGKLFQAARAEYIEVLIAQRDLLEARTVLIDTKRRQLSAVVNVYQALGGGSEVSCPPHDRRADAPQPYLPEVRPPPAPHAERVDERHAP